MQNLEHNKIRHCKRCYDDLTDELKAALISDWQKSNSTLKSTMDCTSLNFQSKFENTTISSNQFQ